MCRSVRDSHQVPQRYRQGIFCGTVGRWDGGTVGRWDGGTVGRWGEGGELQAVDVIGSENQE